MEKATANDALLDAFFRIKDSIVALDNTLTTTYVNQAFADAVGLEVKEMLGKKISDLLPKSEPFMHNQIMESTKTKKVLNFEWTGPYANVFLETTIFPSANGVTIITRDITKRRKAEQTMKENQELFTIAFHNSPAALIITNLEDNRIRDANQSLLNLFEYGREEIINHTTRELGIFPDYTSREELVELMLQKGIVQNREINLKTKTGKSLQCVMSLKLINIQGEKHFLSSVTDVTEYREMKAKMEDYSRNLERIVDERTTQLKNSERLAAIGLTAGMVGHDIRNPLQAILADVYLLKECLNSMPDHSIKNDAAESLDEIDKNISYINKIVADLQDYARPLNPTYTGVDVSEVVTNIVKTAGIPENIQVEVVSNTFKKIGTDPTFIRRILTNLVTNAIQAMPDGGNIELTCFSKADKYYVSVSDTGNGIPEEFKPKLFLPMMTTKAKGQGLGLAVAKRLVEAVNGKIEVESKMGEGTKFTIELPLNLDGTQLSVNS